MAAVTAWNDWHLDEWAGPYPERIIPCQIPWLLDPVLGAEMIERQRRAGIQGGDVPGGSIHASACPPSTPGHWEPFMRACAETGTVVNLHVGSSGASPATTPDAPPDVVGGVVLRVRDVRLPSTGSTHSACGATPDAADLSVGGRDRLGARLARSARSHGALQRHVRHVDLSVIARPRPRCSSRTSGTARSRTARPSCCATASVSTTSCSSPTTRTATRHGDAQRRSSPTSPSRVCPPRTLSAS